MATGRDMLAAYFARPVGAPVEPAPPDRFGDVVPRIVVGSEKSATGSSSVLLTLQVHEVLEELKRDLARMFGARLALVPLEPGEMAGG